MASRKRLMSGWGPIPARSAVKAAAITEPEQRAPAKKNTRAWCKGKPGLEHKPVIVFRSSERGACHLAQGWQLSIWPDEPWECAHREECGSCGKILRDHDKLAGAECPDYPGLREVTGAAGRELAAYEALVASKSPVRRRVITGPTRYRRKRESS